MDNIVYSDDINITQLCGSKYLLENESTYIFHQNVTFNETTTTRTVSFVFHGLGLLILALVGVTTNILSVIVLSHRRLKSSLTTLLLGLTISDTVVISTTFLIFGLHTILKHLQVFSWYVDIGRPFLIPGLLPITLMAQMCSVYFTVVITLERYIAVCLPLQARSLCTRSSAKWSSLVIISISILYNITRWFEYKIVPKEIDCKKGEVTAFEETETEFRLNTFYITYYINWAYLVFMYIIPFTILLYFNAAIYKQTGMHRKIRNSLSPSTVQQGMTEDIQLATMLFGIVITFISCNALAVAINVIESLAGFTYLIKVLIPINNFLIVLGCSTNFIFYCVYGTEFRRRLRRTLRIRSSRKDSCTRSEFLSEKDDSMPVRQRLESLQISDIIRNSSNSNCNSGNNNEDTKYVGGTLPVKVSSDENSDGGHQCDAVRNLSTSTMTVVSVVSDEL